MMNHDTRRRIARSAIQGAIIWSAFGLVESSLGLGVAALMPALALRVGSPVFATALAAVTYASLGAGIGAVTAMMARSRVELVSTLSVIVAVNATLAFGSFGGHSLLPFIAGGLGLAGFAILRATSRGGAIAGAFGSVWFVSAILCGILHLASTAIGQGRMRWAVVAIAVWMGAVMLVAAVGARRRKPITLGQTWRVVGHVGSWLIVLLLTAFGDTGVYRVVPPERAAARADLPNVLLITMDTVRADHASADGAPRETTPFLTRFAGAATRYTAAISSGNMTLTSHASLFTGRYPSFHGALPPAHPLPASVPALAELLQAGGYRTTGIVSNRVYLHPSMGLTRGFEFYDARLPNLWDAPGPVRLPRDLVAFAFWRLTTSGPERPFYRRASDITDGALQQFEASSADGRPFFMFLNYMDAHTLYAPPPPYDRRFQRAPRAASLAEYQAIKQRVATGRAMTAEEHAQLIDAYDGGIAYVDHEIARVLDALSARGLTESTLVIITSDHGEAFGEHGRMEHAASVYQHQVHVPLVVKFPGTRASETVRDPVSLVDVLPTILEAARQPLPAGVQGRSLPRRDGRSLDYVFAEAFPISGGVERAVIDHDARKLIIGPAGDLRLFDLKADPGEQRDVLSRFPAEAAMMRAMAQTIFRPGAFGPPSGAKPDSDVLDRLRSLGYIK